jgi:hypothetical protein
MPLVYTPAASPRTTRLIPDWPGQAVACHCETFACRPLSRDAPVARPASLGPAQGWPE